MNIALTFTGRSLEPYQAQDLAALKDAYGLGEIVSVEVKKPRNLLHHRKLFALLREALDNTEKYSNEQDLLVEVKIRCGHYREYITDRGAIVYVPKSINFEAMDQMEFAEFYADAVPALNDIVPGIPDIEAEVDEIRARKVA